MTKINTRSHFTTASTLAIIVGTLMSAQSSYALNEKTERLGPTTTVAFAAGQSRLSAEAKTQLDTMIKDARAQGKMSEAMVASWSDNPAPRQNEGLSKPDQTLAERRGKAIHTYLKSRSKVGVNSFNMAERAS